MPEISETSIMARYKSNPVTKEIEEIIENKPPPSLNG